MNFNSYMIVPWRAGRRAQFRVFTRTRPPHSMDLLHSLSTAVALVLGLQTADLQVGFGLGPFLLLLTVCLVYRSRCARATSSFQASSFFSSGGHGVGQRRYGFKGEETGVDAATNRPRGRGASCQAHSAGFGRSWQTAILNAAASVGREETLFGAAGVQAVFACTSAWDGFDGDARGLGGFAHSGRAAGDSGASCCQDSGVSGGRRFLVTERAASGGFHQT